MRWEVVEELSDPTPRCFDGSLIGFAQQAFELGEHLFDGVQVWRVGRQEEQPETRRFKDFAHTPPLWLPRLSCRISSGPTAIFCGEMEIQMTMLISRSGARKYLNTEERSQLANLARKKGDATGLLCWVLIETGCRLSEALALQAANIDVRNRAITIESLKKRRRGVYRVVPVSENLVECLRRFIDQAALQKREGGQAKIWTWSRATAYRRICAMMAEGGVRGGHASPRGLRHAFGVAAVTAGIPLNLLQRWLGHADMKTTAIYANASGAEERWLASRLWPLESDQNRRRRAMAQSQCRNCPLQLRPPPHLPWI